MFSRCSATLRSRPGPVFRQVSIHKKEPVENTTFEIGGQCVEILMPVTTTLKEEDKEPPKTKVIGAATRKEEKGSNLVYFILGLAILSVLVYLGTFFVKYRREKRKEIMRWYDK